MKFSKKELPLQEPSPPRTVTKWIPPQREKHLAPPRWTGTPKIIAGQDPAQQQIILKKLSQHYLKIDWRQPHPDLIIIEPEPSITIKQIRELKQKLSLKPFSANFKLAVILEAEKLTPPAQHSLLKTLEEPPNKTIIILCVSQLDLLLPTIISRCEVIKLRSFLQATSPDHQSIITGTAGQRLKLASQHSHTREQAAEFVKNQLFSLRQIMRQKPNLTIVQQLRQTQKALKMLEANVNPKLVLGNLSLHCSAPGAE